MRRRSTSGSAVVWRSPSSMFSQRPSGAVKLACTRSRPGCSRTRVFAASHRRAAWSTSTSTSRSLSGAQRNCPGGAWRGSCSRTIATVRSTSAGETSSRSATRGVPSTASASASSAASSSASMAPTSHFDRVHMSAEFASTGVAVAGRGTTPRRGGMAAVPQLPVCPFRSSTLDQRHFPLTVHFGVQAGLRRSPKPTSSPQRRLVDRRGVANQVLHA